MKLFVRHMVCQRCLYFAKEAFVQEGVALRSMDLGSIETVEELEAPQLKHLDKSLRIFGLSLISDSKTILIAQIKSALIKVIHYTEEIPGVNFSTYLSETLQHDYNYLSNLFSKEEGNTIQQFIIKHKVERIKHILFEEHASLKEIADRMHYSSIGHLSSQFKKCVGITPTEYKKRDEFLLIPLESI